jgi:hypothetical protein
MSWRRHIVRPVLFVNGIGFVMKPGQEIQIMVTATVGHKIECTIQYLDQNGNPMLTAPTPDAPPVWSNTTPAVETLSPAADGSTCEADTLTAGADMISLSLLVGGKAFTATLAVTVGAAPQALTSIAIAATVV